MRSKRHKLRLTFPAAAIVVSIWLTPTAYSQPPGGRGGPNAPDQLIVAKYDTDQDGYLNSEERNVARADLKVDSFGGRRRGPRGRMLAAGTPGPKVGIADVIIYPVAKFYDPTVLRTLFLEFESDNWESELADFKSTDVEIPAKLTVDGTTLPNVGVSFRGASSFFMIPEGLKRSFNISIDFINKEQRLYGYKSLNLLNCSGDPSMMSSILYSYLSGKRIATPHVNYVKVVVNGESWGLYVSSQQFNQVFIKENFETTKGARWKVSGSPRGDGGLGYHGEEIERYRERYEIKSKDKESSWRELINLCRVLNETPESELEEKLAPILDIDGALWFLAVDIATVNSDGYWTRASDYNIYLHPDGKFHILPHDMNEAFQLGHRGGGPPRGGFGPPPDRGGPPRGGGGFGGPPRRRGPGGPGRGGVDLDPLVVSDAKRMPLRSILLSNPKWQRQYLGYVREVAELMKWENIGPIIQQHRALIQHEVAADTRKLFTTDEFESKTSDAVPGEDSTSLRAFLEQRSRFLLNHPKVKALEN